MKRGECGDVGVSHLFCLDCAAVLLAMLCLEHCILVCENGVDEKSLGDGIRPLGACSLMRPQG